MYIEAKSPKRVKNMQFLRNSNMASIVKYLATHGSASRVELSTELGLTKMAISAIISEMIEQELVVESDSLSLRERNYTVTSLGRKPTSLTIHKNKLVAIAIWIARYEIHSLVIEIFGDVTSHKKKCIPASADNEFLIQALTSMIQETIDQNSETHFIGIGIASIGPLDIMRKTLLHPPNFCNIGGVELGQILEERFHYPVFLDNDMNGIALAEYLYGIGKNRRDLVYVGIGSGVGSGIIVNGKILHGNGGFAGELGHISIDSNGLECSCGQKGCLELYTSIPNLIKKTGVTSLKELICIISQPDAPEYLLHCVEEYKSAIQTALVNIANIFDPELIIIGDQILQLITPLLPEIENYMNHHMFHHGSRNIELVPCSFGEIAPLIGAGSIVFQKIFNAELPLRY